MFSKACEYGIRATVYIAAETVNGSKVGIDEICAHIEAPKHFTAKILQVLTRHEIVSSQKGVNGGFYIDPQQQRMPIKLIVEAIDGNKLFIGCGLGLKQCSEERPCPLHHQFVGIREALNKMMDETTIDRLAVKLKNGEIVLMH
ncbi:MAG TPA: Rrf2 family transcriptional regulator [Flavipsychrobacter sp.]|nr:Rrf2 family transcriptional regulator [Flavipsychrobacter sp.]